MPENHPAIEAPPPRRRGRPRDPATGRKIVEAAAALLMERGFDKMTVDDVAAKAGVGKATVYRRWPSKEDLAVAAMHEIFAAEFPIPDTGSLRGDLLDAVHRLLRFVNTPKGEAFMKVGVAESVRDPRIAAWHRQVGERRQERASVMYERAIARGEIPPDAPYPLVADFVIGMLGQAIITGRPFPTVEDAEVLVDFLLHGLAIRPSR